MQHCTAVWRGVEALPSLHGVTAAVRVQTLGKVQVRLVEKNQEGIHIAFSTSAYRLRLGFEYGLGLRHRQVAGKHARCAACEGEAGVGMFTAGVGAGNGVVRGEGGGGVLCV